MKSQSLTYQDKDLNFSGLKNTSLLLGMDKQKCPVIKAYFDGNFTLFWQNIVLMNLTFAYELHNSIFEPTRRP